MNLDDNKLQQAWRRASDADVYRASREIAEYPLEAREIIRAEIALRDLQMKTPDSAGLIASEAANERACLRVCLRRVRVSFVLYWIFLLPGWLSVAGGWIGPPHWSSAIAFAVCVFAALVALAETCVGLNLVRRLTWMTSSAREVKFEDLLWWALALSAIFLCAPGLFLHALLVWRYVQYRGKARAMLSGAADAEADAPAGDSGEQAE